MHPTKAPIDPTAKRLQELTNRLTERLGEAQNIRTRLTRARDANVWPHLQSLSRRFKDLAQFWLIGTVARRSIS
jgi:peptide subunit release factor 1 (eRF1)